MMTGLEAFTAAAAKTEKAAYDNEVEQGKRDQQREHQPNNPKPAEVPEQSGGGSASAVPSNKGSSSKSIQYHDHFTLRTPVSTCSIRHRGNLIHVYDLRTSQIQLVEKKSRKQLKQGNDDDNDKNKNKNQKTTVLELRHITYDRGGGIGFIRLLYTIVAAFFVGVLFVFAFQVILFLFMDLVVDAGLTSSDSYQGNPWKFLGTLSALPIFLYGLSALLATACFFVSEIWQGHTWLKQINENDDSTSTVFFNSVTMEWITLMVNLIIPILVMTFSLFFKSKYWWSNTFYTWFILMVAYYLVFIGLVLYYEIEAAWLISKCIWMKEKKSSASLVDETTIKDFIMESIKHRQNATWSGVYHKVKITAGGLDHYDDHHDGHDHHEEQQQEKQKLDIDPKVDVDVEEQQQQDDDAEKKTEDGTTGGGQQQPSKRRQKSNLFSSSGGVLEPSEQCCMRWYTNVTKAEHHHLKCFFEPVNPPHRVYNLDDFFDKRTFITKYSWSLERIFCSNRRTTNVSVISGPAGVSQNQILSGVICVAISIVLVILLIISGLVWSGSSSAATIIFIILITLCCCLPRIGTIRRILKVYEKFKDRSTSEDEDDKEEDNGDDDHDVGDDSNIIGSNEDEEDDGMYQTYEEYRVTQPTKTFRMIAFVLHITLLYVFPTVILILITNWPLLGLFIIIEIWSAVRYWLDPCILLQNLGSFDYVALKTHPPSSTTAMATTTNNGTTSGGINQNDDGNEGEDTAGKFSNKRQHDDDDLDYGENDVSSWRVRSRISTIMLNVTRSPGRSIWMWTLTLLMLAILSLTIGSIGYFNNQAVQGGTGVVLDDDLYDVSNITGVDGVFWAPVDLTPKGSFEYPPQENMQYPTCRLFKGFQFPDGQSTGLADYAFLATIIYQAPETLQDSLDAWFGQGVAGVDFQTIRDFRTKTAGGAAAVNYQIVNFGDALAVVLVRGSTTSWEWLTDAQLWSAVAFVQVVQEILPAGVIFNPILVGVLRAMSFVESSELKEVALYQQTTDLVKYMREEKGYTDIHITGQSLGGGIALITGAQTNIPAVAISGPNNMFSRQTFDPPLDLESINSMLFNVLPERDVVPMVDKPGLLTQHIACRAKTGSIFGCHTSTRTLCELLYKCGSYDRPPPCECAVKYGYPEANQVAGDQTFTDVCGPNRSNDGWYALPY